MFKRKDKQEKKERKGVMDYLKLHYNDDNDTEPEDLVETGTVDLSMFIPEVKTEEEAYLNNLMKDEGFCAVLDALEMNEPTPLSSLFGVDKTLPKKMRMKYDLATELQESLRDKGIKRCYFRGTSLRIHVMNSYRDLALSLPKLSSFNLSEVSFDVFKEVSSDELVSRTYLALFTAYIPVDVLPRWFTEEQFSCAKDRIDILNHKSILNHQSIFVIRVQFKLLLVIEGKTKESFTEDDTDIKNILIALGNKLLLDALRQNTELKKMRFDIDDFLETSGIGHKIFDPIENYKEFYTSSLTWEKQQYTNFNTVANSLSVPGWGEPGDGTITGEVDFTDDILQLLYKV